jgi:hypothetical protein
MQWTQPNPLDSIWLFPSQGLWLHNPDYCNPNYTIAIIVMFRDNPKCSWRPDELGFLVNAEPSMTNFIASSHP